MKNFNLLLGATALLSTVTSLANADPLPALPDATAHLDVKIGLFNAAGITVQEDTIDFGVLAATGAHTDASVRLDPDGGDRTISGSGVVAADSGTLHKVASLEVNVPDGYNAVLNLPADVVLSTGNGDGSPALDFVPEKYLEENPQYGDLAFDVYSIGGSIDLSGKFHGNYSGGFTVTAVYSEDEG